MGLMQLLHFPQRKTAFMIGRLFSMFALVSLVKWAEKVVNKISCGPLNFPLGSVNLPVSNKSFYIETPKFPFSISACLWLVSMSEMLDQILKSLYLWLQKCRHIYIDMHICSNAVNLYLLKEYPQIVNRHITRFIKGEVVFKIYHTLNLDVF